MIDLKIDDIWVKIIGAALTAIGSTLLWMFRGMHKDTAQMKLDVAVVKAHMGTAIKAINQLSKLSEDLIRLDERQKKLTQDVNHLHAAKRDMQVKLSQLS